MIGPFGLGSRAFFVLLIFSAGNLVCWGQDEKVGNDSKAYGPLAPEVSAKQFDVADGLVFEPVLTEPAVRQPLFMDFDERGRLWVVQYLQYPYPAGLKPLSRDKHWRMVFDKVPAAPPNHVRGQDVISIHEDSDHDGTFDTQKTFVDGLSITTSFALGRGGVWVLNPPYLLFYPDKNGDDVPDGDPELHLSGFGIEDTHSNANSLRWGPDGWLYGCQGSTVSGHILVEGLAGKKPAPVHSMGQLVWRYHPKQRKYEIFAEGGGNAFGLEVDSAGRIFSGHNGGNTRGFHYVQGGFYQKSFGKHGVLSNPYSFGYFSWMGHNDVPRFTHNFVIYEGNALPDVYTGRVFGIGPLQSHVIMADMFAEGSTFASKDVGVPVQSREDRFRPVDIKVGPDGAIYVADFYEKHISHRQHYSGMIEKDTGRIYRLKSADAKPRSAFDFGQETSAKLVDRLLSPNKWDRQMALRVLGDRRDTSVVPKLLEIVRSKTVTPRSLDALWALHLSAGMTREILPELLAHPYSQVRMWTVRLLGDGQVRLGDETIERLSRMAREDSSEYVRSQLASTAKRLPVDQMLAIVDGLTIREADISDPHIPLLIWWAIERHADVQRKPLLNWLKSADVWDRPMVRQHLLSKIMRRYARAGRRRDLLTCAELLKLAPNQELAGVLLQGFEKAFAGRSLTGLPDELLLALEESGGGSDALKLRQGDARTVTKALELIANDAANPELRRQYIEILSETRATASVPVLLSAAVKAKPESIQIAALDALQAFEDAGIAERILVASAEFRGDVLNAAHSLLASRADWAYAWLQKIQADNSKSNANVKDSVSLDVVWQMQMLKHDGVQSLIKSLWGDSTSATNATLKVQVEQLQTVLSKDVGDPYAGEKVFNGTCAKCHRLYDYGADVGPNLTSYQRSDTSRMLLNIVNPSAEIRESYETWVIVTDDGRTVAGFKTDEDDRVVVLRSASGQKISVRKSEIDDIQQQRRSLMPEGLLKNLSDDEIRDLFAYLRTSQPLP